MEFEELLGSFIKSESFYFNITRDQASFFSRREEQDAWLQVSVNKKENFRHDMLITDGETRQIVNWKFYFCVD